MTIPNKSGAQSIATQPCYPHPSFAEGYRRRGELLKEAARLLQEVVREHANPYMVFYNHCDDGLCKWCEDAMKIIDAELKGA